MHIVLVEDDEVIRETTQISLERFGYTVSSFEDGRDGYEFVAAHGADVVLLDLMLPTMNGASICRAIREKSTVPIIIISARSEPIDIVQALEAGADDYLVKPFDMQVLNARIRAVVRRFITAGTEPMGFSPDEIGPPAAAGQAASGQAAAGQATGGGSSGGFAGIPEVLGPSPGLANPVGGQPVPAGTAPGPHAGHSPAAGAETPAVQATDGTQPAGGPAAGGSAVGGSAAGGSAVSGPAAGAGAARHDRSAYRTRLGSLEFDSARLTVMVDDAEVHLTPTELRVLLLLTEEPGHVYSREKIAFTVWGYEWAGDSRVVDVHIQRLRKKIGARMIETVRGFGYRFAG